MPSARKQLDANQLAKVSAWTAEVRQAEMDAEGGAEGGGLAGGDARGDR